MSSTDQCQAEVKGFDTNTVVLKLQEAMLHPEYAALSERDGKVYDLSHQTMAEILGVPLPDDGSKVMAATRDLFGKQFSVRFMLQNSSHFSASIIAARLVMAAGLIANGSIKDARQEVQFFETVSALTLMSNMQTVLERLIKQHAISLMKLELTTGHDYFSAVLALYQIRLLEQLVMLEDNLPEWWKLPEAELSASNAYIFCMISCVRIVLSQYSEPQIVLAHSVAKVYGDYLDLIKEGKRSMTDEDLIESKIEALYGLKLPENVINAVPGLKTHMKSPAIEPDESIDRRKLDTFGEFCSTLEYFHHLDKYQFIM